MRVDNAILPYKVMYSRSSGAVALGYALSVSVCVYVRASHASHFITGHRIWKFQIRGGGGGPQTKMATHCKYTYKRDRREKLQSFVLQSSIW